MPLPLCALRRRAAPPRLLARPPVRAHRTLQLADGGTAALDLRQRGQHLVRVRARARVRVRVRLRLRLRLRLRVRVS